MTSERPESSEPAAPPPPPPAGSSSSSSGQASEVAGPSARAAAPGWLARIGLAIGHPRRALAIAADRRYTGRSGSDLILAIALLLAATQLRGLAAAAWLATEVSLGQGVRALRPVLTGTLAVDLGLLLLGALSVFAVTGARRDLGRAFDLACVAALPLVVVDLVATVAVRAAGVTAVPAAASWLLSALSYGWMGALIALAIRPARSVGRVPAASAPEGASAVRAARWLGGGVAAVAALGAALQVAWIAGHLELVKPMKTGERAPAIELPRIEAGGALGDRVTLASSGGKVIVLDFWATWCGPCLAAMPRLDQLARSHPDVTVIAINIDDPAAARTMFDQRGWVMTLVADDGDASQRYGVSSIPHTVIVDRRGMVRQVIRGARSDLAVIVETIRASE